jgi:hypothetical protein
MMTVDEYILTYIEARHAKIPLEKQGRVERAGYYLLITLRGEDDGSCEPDVDGALVRALIAGEIDAAVEISDAFLPEVEPDPRHRSRCNGNFSAKGCIEA